MTHWKGVSCEKPCCVPLFSSIPQYLFLRSSLLFSSLRLSHIPCVPSLVCCINNGVGVKIFLPEHSPSLIPICSVLEIWQDSFWLRTRSCSTPLYSTHTHTHSWNAHWLVFPMEYYSLQLTEFYAVYKAHFKKKKKKNSKWNSYSMINV